MLLCMVERLGESCGVVSSSAFTVEVEVDRPKPLVSGARCVSFNSKKVVSRCLQPAGYRCSLLVNFHDILGSSKQSHKTQDRSTFESRGETGRPRERSTQRAWGPTAINQAQGTSEVRLRSFQKGANFGESDNLRGKAADQW